MRLTGDDWRVEAVVLKWKLPALLAGVPPLYRLDRLSGRYDDPGQEMSAPRTVIHWRNNPPTNTRIAFTIGRIAARALRRYSSRGPVPNERPSPVRS